VSYSLHVASEASRILAELPFEVQEDVWDLFDKFAADPGVLGVQPDHAAEVHEYRQVTQGRTIRVFFAVVIDDRNQRVLVPVLEYTIS
jgi:hypothetical protein